MKQVFKLNLAVKHAAVFFASITLLFQTQAYAEDVWTTLQKTAIAARSLNYSGIFVYQNGSQLRTVQIVHINDGTNEFARNTVMEGEPREVYSKGKDVVIIKPKNDKVVMEKRHGQNLFPAILPSSLDTIKISYSARLGVNEAVSGRSTQIIYLESKDNYRYNYKLWVDEENNLLLKMMLLYKNETLEQVEFNQIDFINNPKSSSVQPKIDVSKSYVVDDATQSSHANGGNWQISVLPPGYRKIDQIEIKVPNKNVIVNQLIYSDGLAAVSLFIEPVSKGVRPKTGHITMGSTNMCANVNAGHQIIVIGEVPATTVMEMSKAVSFK
ncbi:MAG: MucB/RseB C-terminal domain-containing protein [Methylophilaceae bacterium]|nr:MucB/RseB C-terminal domain-containing protein [Methylophilaceae bacterium]